MNTYELTTWIGDELADRERLDALTPSMKRKRAASLGALPPNGFGTTQPPSLDSGCGSLSVH